MVTYNDGEYDAQMNDEGVDAHYDWIVIDTDGTVVAWANTEVEATEHALALGLAVRENGAG